MQILKFWNFYFSNKIIIDIFYEIFSTILTSQLGKWFLRKNTWISCWSKFLTCSGHFSKIFNSIHRIIARFQCIPIIVCGVGILFDDFSACNMRANIGIRLRYISYAQYLCILAYPRAESGAGFEERSGAVPGKNPDPGQIQIDSKLPNSKLQLQTWWSVVGESIHTIDTVVINY